MVNYISIFSSEIKEKLPIQVFFFLYAIYIHNIKFSLKVVKWDKFADICLPLYSYYGNRRSALIYRFIFYYKLPVLEKKLLYFCKCKRLATNLPKYGNKNVFNIHKNLFQERKIYCGNIERCVRCAYIETICRKLGVYK